MKKKVVGIASFMILTILIGLNFYQIGQMNENLLSIEIHVTMHHYRNGRLLTWSHHAGTITNIGLNFTKEKLGYDTGNLNATYIALSNSTSSPSASWTDLPAEITTGNMSRAQGTYVPIPAQNGKWNVTYTFSPTETNSTRLVGLLWNTGASVLLASDTITPINYESSDTIEITWSITVS